MRDPNLNMEQDTTEQQQTATAQGTESRKNQNKSVRVAFGPDLKTYIPPRDESPAPAIGHHRSFTSVEPRQAVASVQPRSTSSAGKDTAVPEVVAGAPSDRASGGRPAPTLKRVKSDYGPRMDGDKKATGDDDEDFAMRHGWQEEYTSSEYLKLLHSVSIENPPHSTLQCHRTEFNFSRISICTTRRNAMRRVASQGSLTQAGQTRTGA